MENIVNKKIVAGNDKHFEQATTKNNPNEPQTHDASVRNSSTESVSTLPSNGRGHSVFVSGFNRKK